MWAGTRGGSSEHIFEVARGAGRLPSARPDMAMSHDRRYSDAAGYGGPGRSVRSLATGLAVVVAFGGLVLAGISDGYPTTRPHLLSGAAWLASSRVGQLTLLDG